MCHRNAIIRKDNIPTFVYMRPAYFCIFFCFFTLMIATARDNGEINFSADNQSCQSISPDSGIISMPPETRISLKRIIGTTIARNNFHEILLKNINLSRINIPVRTEFNHRLSDRFTVLHQRALPLIFYAGSDQEDHHPVK
jgi:hypothetical protein